MRVEKKSWCKVGLTRVVDVQLIHDPLVPAAEHHHQLLDGHRSVSVPGPRDGPGPAEDALPPRLQHGRRAPSGRHDFWETQRDILELELQHLTAELEPQSGKRAAAGGARTRTVATAKPNSGVYHTRSSL